MKQLCALVVLALTLGACGSDDGGGGAGVVLDETDVGAEVSVEVGEQFEVRLESNATTGYAWQVVEQPDAITLVSSEFEAPDTSLVGAGGIEVFVFEGASAGSGELRLEYVRSFENPPVPAETADYRVQVTGS
jgi:inhibitor of cysteine peptidase